MLLSSDKMVISQFIKAMSFNITVFCIDKKPCTKIFGTDTFYIYRGLSALFLQFMGHYRVYQGI